MIDSDIGELSPLRRRLDKFGVYAMGGKKKELGIGDGNDDRDDMSKMNCRSPAGTTGGPIKTTVPSSRSKAACVREGCLFLYSTTRNGCSSRSSHIEVEQTKSEAN